MANKITDVNLIKTTQIQQKQTDNSMIALRPETQADIVINTSTNILGATVDEAFDNALPVVGAGAVEVNLKNNQLEISVDQSKILPTGGTAGQVITSNGDGTTKWNTPSVATSSTANNVTTITINKTAGVSGDTVSTYDKTTIDSKIAAVDQFKYKVSTDAASTPEGITWKDLNTTITGTLKASASTEFCIYLVPDTSGVESGVYIEYMTVKNDHIYIWEPIGTTRVDIPEYTIATNNPGNQGNQIQLLKDGAVVNAVTINNVANATTASKLGSTTVGSTTEPIYLNNGTATKCSLYAGGTKVTLNGVPNGSSAVSFYAPIGSGTSGQILVSKGDKTAPAWSSWTTAGLLKTNASGVVSVDTTKYAQSAKLQTGGTYSVVSYNTDGIITAGGNIIKYYAKTASTGPSTDNDLVQGGFAFIEI